MTSWRNRKHRLRNGKNYIDMDELTRLDNLQKVLLDFAKDAEELYKYQIALGTPEWGNKNASRQLTDSVKAIVTFGETEYEVSLELMEYWKYIEGGSKGTESSPEGAVYPAHFPPVNVLLDWINVKPILPRPMANGKLPSPETLAFLIGRKILHEGIEPFPAMATTKEELMRIYRDKISEALGHDMEYYIRKVYDES